MEERVPVPHALGRQRVLGPVYLSLVELVLFGDEVELGVRGLVLLFSPVLLLLSPREEDLMEPVLFGVPQGVRVV